MRDFLVPDLQLVLGPDEEREALDILFPEVLQHPEDTTVPNRSIYPNRRSVTMSVRMNQDIRERLAAIADKFCTSSSEILRRLVYAQVEEFPGKFVEYRLPLEQAVSPKPHEQQTVLAEK